jgi:hypothetical protein
VEQYLSTSLKVKANDLFEVYEVELPDPPPPEAFVE